MRKTPFEFKMRYTESITDLYRFKQKEHCFLYVLTIKRIDGSGFFQFVHGELDNAVKFPPMILELNNEGYIISQDVDYSDMFNPINEITPV